MLALELDIFLAVALDLKFTLVIIFNLDVTVTLALEVAIVHVIVPRLHLTKLEACGLGALISDLGVIHLLGLSVWLSSLRKFAIIKGLGAAV